MIEDDIMADRLLNQCSNLLFDIPKELLLYENTTFSL